jgi:hypothetical protein
MTRGEVNITPGPSSADSHAPRCGKNRICALLVFFGRAVAASIGEQARNEPLRRPPARITIVDHDPKRTP